MDERTLTALKESIAHWEANVAAETLGDVRLGCAHCALCQEFPGLDCAGCPVAAATGDCDCEGSPYDQAVRAYRRWRSLGGEHRTEWRAAAQAEVDFLRSLLPADEASP